MVKEQTYFCHMVGFMRQTGSGEGITLTSSRLNWVERALKQADMARVRERLSTRKINGLTINGTFERTAPETGGKFRFPAPELSRPYF